VLVLVEAVEAAAAAAADRVTGLLLLMRFAFAWSPEDFASWLLCPAEEEAACLFVLGGRRGPREDWPLYI
jgi:hypothetical protein